MFNSNPSYHFSSHSSQDNDQPWRQLPKSQQPESENSEPEIYWLENRTRPHRIVEGRKQQTYHGRVDAADCRLKAGACTQRIPKWERTGCHQKAWEKNTNERESCAG